MKSLRLALAALALPLVLASSSLAQYSNWGVSRLYHKAAFGRALFDNNAVRSTGCDNGCDTGCDAAEKPACGCESQSSCSTGKCKACKLVKIEVEVKAVCYGVKCSDICVPGCGSGCTNTKCVTCGDKGCDCCEAGANCKVTYATGKPGCCANPKTIKRLVKYETKKVVCGYKWVVVDNGCCSCDSGCNSGCDDKASGADGDDVPPVPVPEDPFEDDPAPDASA
jgi:hypothetical protein